MEKLIGAAVVGQSGGPTSAINATLAGVIRGAFPEKGKTITALYGMRNGIEGLISKNLVDLFERFKGSECEREQMLSELEHTPAAALGSCRKKLPVPEKDDQFYKSLIDVFKEYNIRYFFYIGGNDSMDTVAKLSAYLKNSDYDMRVIGLPKTIDNDLPGTDHTPGFGSAAKFIAATMQEIIRDCAVYTIPAVTIVEIMGRDAGWLTASAALPRIICGVAPDFVYLPERSFDMEKFLIDVKSELAKKPNVVIAVSEGLRFADGKYVGEGTQSGVVDVFGHKYLAGTGKALEHTVKREIGCKVRSIELNLPQRCAAHITSLTDLTESAEVGQFGFNAAIEGNTGSIISIIRNNDSKYSVSYKVLDISEAANKTRHVPDEFINERGNNVTDECLEYIKPLILGEPNIRYEGGIPYNFVI